MKLKEWKVLTTDKSKDCKHTRFVCEDCGAFIFQVKIPTKTSLAQQRRALRRLSEAVEELNIENEEEG